MSTPGSNRRRSSLEVFVEVLQVKPHDVLQGNGDSALLLGTSAKALLEWQLNLTKRAGLLAVAGALSWLPGFVVVFALETALVGTNSLLFFHESAKYENRTTACEMNADEDLESLFHGADLLAWCLGAYLTSQIGITLQGKCSFF
jgi:hypothetical protein